MKIHIDDFIELTLQRLCENPSPASAFSAEREGISLRDLIRSMAEQGTREGILATPREQLDDLSHLGKDIGWLPDGAGYVMLPDDFLLLVAFRMSDWSRSVTKVAEEGSITARVQASPWIPLRGQPHRPVCVLTQRGVGRALEFYSCRSRKAEILEAVYVGRPRIDGRGYMRLPSASLFRAVTATAESVTQIIGKDGNN